MKLYDIQRCFRTAELFYDIHVSCIEERHRGRSTVLRKVLDIGVQEYNKRKAVDEYRKGEMSIGRASEIADVSIAEFYKILENENVPISIDFNGIKESLEADLGK